MERDMAALKNHLKHAKHITVIAGAGLSTASGIPTFRGPGGMWRKYDAMSLATPEAFRRNPSRSWAFYEYRRQKALRAQPNQAHIALAKFANSEQRRATAPECSSFALITQNVDGLSRRAIAGLDDPKASESAPLLEMHGNIAQPHCTSCKKEASHYDLTPIAPALAGIIEQVDTQGPEVDIPEDKLPRCKSCKGLMRPGVVWFGEMPKHLNEIDAILRKTDLLLVVGTSSTVYPAAGFAHRVSQLGGRVAIFNLEACEGDADADFVIHGPCEETLPEILLGV